MRAPAAHQHSLEFVIISLRGSVERREMMANMMGRLPWPWRFFDARSPGEGTLAYDPRRAIVKRGYALNPAEIACFESHFQCMREHAMSKSRAEYMIVLEDDVLIDGSYDFASVPEIMSRLDIHYIRLYSRFVTRVRWLGRFNHRSLIRFVVPPYGTQAYVVSRSGARNIINSVAVIERPIDDEMDRYWKNGLPTYAVFPYPVLELNHRSTIAKGSTGGARLSVREKALALGFTWADKVPREFRNFSLRKLDRKMAKLLHDIHMSEFGKRRE